MKEDVTGSLNLKPFIFTMPLIDIIICVGSKDAKDIKTLVNNIKEYIIDVNKIYLIMPKKILQKYRVFDYIVENIDETIFPFDKEYIDNLFKCPERSGWYLQQLLKIYAPIVIPNILDNFVIIDADTKFYNKVNFFENDTILFNVDLAQWEPYIEHIEKLFSKIKITTRFSGVTNVMPMKRHIIENMLEKVKEEHNEEFWKVFLDKVDPQHYQHSGASEYEMLFHFTLTFFPDESKIRPLKFKNSNRFTYNSTLVYENRQTNK